MQCIDLLEEGSSDPSMIDDKMSSSDLRKQLLGSYRHPEVCAWILDVFQYHIGKLIV